MRKIPLFLILFVALFGQWSFVSAGTTHDDQIRPERPAPLTDINNAGQGCSAGTNLLANPSFEGQYSSFMPPNGHPDCPAGICTTAQMAPNWSPWWLSHNPSDPGHIIRMPEYKPASSIFTNPPRVRTGDSAQQFFTFFSTHRAGLMQQVPVTADKVTDFALGDIHGLPMMMMMLILVHLTAI